MTQREGNLVQVTVGQRPHVAAGLAHCGVATHVLSEHVVLACGVYVQSYCLSIYVFIYPFIFVETDNGSSSEAGRKERGRTDRSDREYI